MDVGKRIIYFREKRGYTQNGLAERAGVSQSHLRRIELGQADITVSHLELLCDAMNISLSDFFNNTDNENKLTKSLPNLSPQQIKLLIEFINSLQ